MFIKCDACNKIYIQQASVQGEGCQEACPPPLDIEKQKKKKGHQSKC